MREEGKERKEGKGWMRMERSDRQCYVETENRKRVLPCCMCQERDRKKNAGETMLHADKRNSCSAGRSGGVLRGATCLLRQDKGQRDTRFRAIKITYSAEEIIYGRPSWCLAAMLFGALPPLLWYQSQTTLRF